MGWGMGIPIGWPNATYQSGEKPVTAKILASPDFDIQADENYTIEFWAGGISPSVSGKNTFFSFGTDQSVHSAFLVNIGSFVSPVWSFRYITNNVEIFNVDITSEIENNIWNFFCIERKDNFTWLGLNGIWIYATGTGSPAISSEDNPMYVGSDNIERVLNGSMNNFRWSNYDVYNTSVPFTVPTADLGNDPGTIMLVIQGSNFANSLVDQSGYNHYIIPGTKISYNAANPFGNNPAYAGNLRFV
jgi:hypothetical protein